MNNLPNSIKHPETFLKSPAAGFDGVFDWSFTDGCFGKTKITPMDFDGVVERNGNFLVFETKAVGVPVPKGQMITYKTAHKLGCFTVVFIEGKQTPEFAKVWCQPGFKNGNFMNDHAPVDDLQRFKGFVSEWYDHANKNKFTLPDVSFLNKQILSLKDTLDATKQNAEKLIIDLGGKVVW